MKFLCDRCNTRYSIGDDRVRGKILKIRCKNCQNVITVREGMPDADAVDPGRRAKSVTQAVPLAPQEQVSANGGRGAPSKPPPALDEEWYVSIDGEQSGPFSLPEAQRWVASKAFDADLHCWCEGFDDWLPVDKVSHFRSLRKSPTPPPVPPRAASATQRPAARAAVQEDEVKPLFAATMASIERSAADASQGAKVGLPNPSAPATFPTGAPVQPLVARANGTASTPALPPHGNGAGPPLRRPMLDASEPATPLESPASKDEARAAAEPAARARADASDGFAQALAQQARPAAKPEPRGAKPSSHRDADVSDKTKSAPIATRKADASSAGKESDAFAARSPGPVAASARPQPELDDDDDLDIGEVSRVVNLGDLMKAAPGQAAAAARRTQPQMVYRTSPMLRVGGTAQVPLLPASELGLGAAGGPTAPDASLVLAPVPPVSHRRGMIALMVGALLLLGITGALVLAVMSGDDGFSGGLGGGVDYDTTRPDDPIRPRGSGGLATAPPVTPQNPFVPKRPVVRPNTNLNPVGPQVPDPDARALRPDEVEEMAGKYSGTTQRCYIRSQRGAEAFTIGDLKKIGVTLTVDKEGVVTTVQLSDHASTSLGKCLISAIRSWKFRQSSSGITAKITMVFQSG